MPYDNRIWSPVDSYRSLNPSQNESLELGPWPTPASPDESPYTHQSTEGLLRPLGFILPDSSSSHNKAYGTPVSWRGWKFGARLCILVVALVLVLNTIVTAWAIREFGIPGGIGTIHTGSCAAIKSTGLWLHILINILSTMLLGASNYYMQCLCSPTRGEVDRAHSNNNWLDIGIQSVRNLRSISRRRTALWLVFALTSIPLHIMFNSATFVSLTANRYTVAAVTENFVAGAVWTFPSSDEFYQTIVTEMQKNISNYERLDPPDCIKQYGVDYLSSRRHVVVVVEGTDADGDSLVGILDWAYNQPQNSWVCGTGLGDDKTLVAQSIADFDCSIPVALSSDNAPWQMNNQTVQYCLSEQVPDKCRLQFAVPIMAVVLGCNFAKLCCMIITLLTCNMDEPLVTLGDALSSFLTRSDPYTKGMCIITRNEIEKGNIRPGRMQPKRWEKKRHFRLEAVGIRRWILSNMLCAGAVVAISVLLRFALQNTTTASDLATLWSLGFGTVTSSSLIYWDSPLLGSPGLMKNVLIANSPQVALTLLYTTYNRLFTCMAISKEWNDFASRWQPLRVTSPRGDQVSTYFLSLPYRYILPILGTSIATHWILSQSLFLVAIDVFDEDGNLDTGQTILTCGFSCIALIFLIAIGWMVLLIGVGLGFRRFKGGIPLVGSCSAAISAACHPLPDEGDVALVELMWGVVSIEKGVGHCALSGRYVSTPIPGRLYLGSLYLGSID